MNMCEMCEQRFRDLDPNVLMVLDQFTPEMIDLLDRLAPALGPKMTGVTIGSINKETGENTVMSLEEAPPEIREAMKGLPERYARNIAGSLIMGYLAYRYAIDSSEASMMSIAMPEAVNEGAMMGQIVHKRLEMLQENGGGLN